MSLLERFTASQAHKPLNKSAHLVIGNIQPPQRRAGKLLVNFYWGSDLRKIIISEVAPAPPQPKIDNALLKALARSHRWRRMIEGHEYASITELAKAEGINQSYACRLLRLTLLSPAIVTEILNGRQNSNLLLKQLSKPFPVEWQQQSRLFNCDVYASRPVPG